MSRFDDEIPGDIDRLVAWFEEHAATGTGTHPTHGGPDDALLEHPATPTIVQAMLRVVETGSARGRAAALSWLARGVPTDADEARAACLRWLATPAPWLDTGVDGSSPRRQIARIAQRLYADGPLLERILADLHPDDVEGWALHLATRGEVALAAALTARQVRAGIALGPMFVRALASVLSRQHPAGLPVLARALVPTDRATRLAFLSRSGDDPSAIAEVARILDVPAPSP